MSGVSSQGGGHIGDQTNGIAKSALYVGAGGLLAQDNPDYTYDYTTDTLGFINALCKTAVNFFGNSNAVTGKFTWDDSTGTLGGTRNTLNLTTVGGGSSLFAGTATSAVQTFLDFAASTGGNAMGCSGGTSFIVAESTIDAFGLGTLILTGTNKTTGAAPDESLASWLCFGSDGTGSVLTPNVMSVLAGDDWNAGGSATKILFFITNTGGGQVTPLILNSDGKVGVNTIGLYNLVATAGSGVAPIYGRTDLTNQSAAIASTALFSVLVTGLHRISYSETITTVGTVSSTLGNFQIIYTDGNDGVVKTTPAGPTSTANTLGTQVNGTIIVYAQAATVIRFTNAYTSAAAASMKYALNISVEEIG